MKRLLHLLIQFFISLLFSFQANSQYHFYSDCLYGGVVGDGYSPWIQGYEGQIQLPIPTGSIVKKALLFSNIYKYEHNIIPAINKEILINGLPVTLTEQSTLNNPVYLFANSTYVETIAIDITEYIDINIISYDLTTFVSQSPTVTPLFSDFYVIVLFENSMMPITCIDIFVNNHNAMSTVDYTLVPSNLIHTNGDIGLAVHGSSICDTLGDGYYVHVNNQNIGLIGGREDNTSSNCGGVLGSFQYFNNTLIGIGNDTENSLMSGVDALANIQPYMNGQNIDVNFVAQSNTSPRSNLINQLFLTYTSSCDTFSVTVSNDTTVCAGQQVPLLVTGGQRYEWTPAVDLSCYNCPNPVFTGDESRYYSVRIWNDDNCSVIRAVNVGVNHPKANLYVGDTECGYSYGLIKGNPSSYIDETYYIVTPELDTLMIFNNEMLINLPPADYRAFSVNEYGCRSADTTITINSVMYTQASFTASPTDGAVPLLVDYVNESTHALNYQWLVNGVNIGDNPLSLFENAGTYEIGLIAWSTIPNCADTVWTTIHVYDSLITQIPNVITPNGDGINDQFIVSVNMKAYGRFVLLNRWGNIIYEWEGELVVGANSIWNGLGVDGNSLTHGTYFYKMFITTDGENSNCVSQDCIQEKSGFVEVTGAK